MTLRHVLVDGLGMRPSPLDRSSYWWIVDRQLPGFAVIQADDTLNAGNEEVNGETAVLE